MGRMFQIFFFVKKILKTEENRLSFFKNLESMNRCKSLIYGFFETNSGSIEIGFKGRLERIFFIKQPATLFLRSEVKEHFSNNVDRSDANAKLKDFLERAPKLMSHMDLGSKSYNTGNAFLKMCTHVNEYISRIILGYCTVLSF